MGERTANVKDANMGEVLEELAAVIHSRATAAPEDSYTALMLSDQKADKLLSKLAEESSEIIMACKDNDHDHIRYEMADLLYHLLVVAEKYHISVAELAGELAARRK